MSNRIVILPGIPDDDNRDYLPERIKGTEYTLNENGNNSQVYPKRLVEHTEAIVDVEPDTWYEYVPESYDPSKPTPLVFSMHGGLMNGWGQAIYSSWTMVADREGFICVFPSSHTPGMWALEHPREMKMTSIAGRPIPPSVTPDESRDCKLVFRLIEIMKQKYNIDTGRIYMQGMSMGNAMTTMFARAFGNVLAGIGESAGPTGESLLYNEDGTVKNRGGALAVFQTRPEFNAWPNDCSPEDVKRNMINRDYWLTVNGCSSIPQIAIKGEHNFAFYSGGKADLVFLDIKNRDHGQALDEAELMWDYLFSGTRRDAEGKIVQTDPKIPRKGDEFAIAIAEGCSNAWFRNSVVPMGGKAIKWQKLKYHGLNGGQKVRGEYLCVPVRFLAEVFGAEYTPSGDTLSASLRLDDGRELQFARGVIGCLIDGHIESMLCEALHRNGELYISFEWFCKRLYDLHVSEMAGTIYATDHYSVLSNNMAHIIRDLIR